MSPIPALLANPVELAALHHLDGAKRLSDRFKRELGFVNRAILHKAIVAQELLLIPAPNQPLAYAETGPEIAGFTHFYVRRDATITLYSIVVDRPYRNMGVGRRMFAALVEQARQHDKTQILLKCPTELSANLFYERLGLEIVRVEAGKLRPLNVWAYRID